MAPGGNNSVVRAVTIYDTSLRFLVSSSSFAHLCLSRRSLRANCHRGRRVNSSLLQTTIEFQRKKFSRVEAIDTRCHRIIIRIIRYNSRKLNFPLPGEGNLSENWNHVSLTSMCYTWWLFQTYKSHVKEIYRIDENFMLNKMIISDTSLFRKELKFLRQTSKRSAEIV